MTVNDDLPCIQKNLERTFQLIDLSNCLFQLQTCSLSYFQIERPLLIVHNTIVIEYLPKFEVQTFKLVLSVLAYCLLGNDTVMSRIIGGSKNSSVRKLRV